MSIGAISVVATSAIALASIVLTYVLGSRRLVHERQIADLEGVRGTLDNAAVELHHVAYLLDEIRSQVTQHKPDFARTDTGTEIFTKLGERGRSIDSITERLRIRFGRQNEVALAFQDAGEAQLDIYRALGLVRLEGDFDDSPSGRHAALEFDRKIRERLDHARVRFDEARNRFIDEANRAAGARLRGSD